MAIHSPPFYRYTFVEAEWDKWAFEKLKEIGKNKKYPKVLGSELDINTYLVALIRTQKSLNDWRGLLKDTLSQVEKNKSIDTLGLSKMYPPESISMDIPEWVTYPPDKIVSDFIDALATKYVRFNGSNIEISEFILRFILGQLSHDWECTIMMVWEMLGDSKELNVRDLNREMRNFDYMKLFE
ncbi:hypothetical protein COU88_04565 [Candidatus Roizmanbacteria bacterium CG10_big_fil_rev_8_21_14_0_10_39_6]|uniref:Uncharacterized protein n=1 Tax=Candidatus Roizmanbacteria bacterium CG10_big_fil_rev_8_21_14_0_10_39_6 TaxID=1974853 RepID=A0A2M8KRI9_9BACT|nr:MAG: hypothetical protein COU88_04565 [Candidatus Roizmanbacteria bacterium CG10_big_fil_rev_8_21_14_0_10_39_6]